MVRNGFVFPEIEEEEEPFEEDEETATELAENPNPQRLLQKNQILHNNKKRKK